MLNSRLSTVVVMLVIISSSIAVGSSTVVANDNCDGADKNIVVEKSPDFGSHVEYTFQFSEEEERYCVLVENKGETESLSGFRASADNRSTSPQMPVLEPGESKYVSKEISEHLDVKRDGHKVTLGAYNETFVYNFTEELNATDPDVPAPYIEDTEVIRDEENDSTSLRVAVRNPTKRGYGIYVQAKTFGTERVDDIGAPQENETRVFELPLEESSDEVVAGKVRVFDNWGEPEGKFDQKEFLAEPGEDTNAWDDEFEHMPGTDSSQSYSNESAEQYRDGFVGRNFSATERRVGAGLAVALLVGAAWRRYRR